MAGNTFCSVTSWNHMPANATFVSGSWFPPVGRVCSKINDAVDHFPERRLFNASEVNQGKAGSGPNFNHPLSLKHPPSFLCVNKFN